jgi:hypothetical protein
MTVLTQLYLQCYQMFQLHVSAIVKSAIVRLKTNYRRKHITQSGSIYISWGGGGEISFYINSGNVFRMVIMQ